MIAASKGNRIERWLVGAACFMVGCFYLWTVRSSGDPWKFGEEQRDYYNLLIDGYLNGQLNMKVEVPEALLKLADPYDPGARPAGLGLHDASFYKGKYYVYFGAAPMVVLMLPFRLLTGMDLPLQVAVLVFTYAGFLASVATWLAIRRRYFPETSPVTAVAAVLVLGLAGLGPVLLRRPDMWELPIAGGYCFAMLALYCVWQCLHAERRRGKWLAAASLCTGLAIASRPTYLVASPFLVVPLVWWWWRERRLPWRMALRVVVPLAVIGTAMAWHNYARFDDPLQFGQKYQFSLDYESKLPHFRAAYVPFTANAHFLSVARWSRYFPFIHRADLGEAPPGFTMHRGDVYGLLTNFPIACLAFLAPLALWRREPDERGRMGAWLVSAALLFALSAGLMLFFFSALARYQMDFSPAFILIACVGLLGVERWLVLFASRVWRRFARAIWLFAAGISVAFGMLVSLGFERLLNEHNPALEQNLARLLNRIPAAVEWVAGVRHGPIELTIQLPASPRAGRETLFTIGEPPDLDRVFLNYTDDQRVQFGIKRRDRPERSSRPLSLEANSTHRVSILMESLFPPATHPYFSDTSPEEVRRLNRLVGIALDGEPVLFEHLRASSAVGGKVRAGEAALTEAAYPPFGGRIVALRRQESASDWQSPTGNFVRVRLAFSSARIGECEPLLAFESAEAGRVLAVTRTVENRVQFSLLGKTGEAIRSDVVEIESSRVRELIVRTEAGNGVVSPRLYVFVDEQLMWAPRVDGGIRFPATITVGRTLAGITECAEAFRGEIFSVQQDMQGRDPLDGPGGTLRMKLRFPSNRASGHEPVVVTGCTGAGDLLIVDYLDANTVRFALDHWGAPTRTSGPIPVDTAKVHELEVTMASLKTVADASEGESGQPGTLQLKLDGVVVWEEPLDFYKSELAEIAIGRNAIGGTRCGPVFGGDILAVERVTRE